ncbi:unnamed protein product [Mytilus coruscus]|uniref:Ig-like domain-containing protein n=1 Tax=Mytilus coruscus TaxID=42192 RepID=A0A6J8EXG5_MYTCO|nr:unnamed protein product [Mytilus coruscus]
MLPASGEYLFGRVTLTNITNTSTNATLTFHILKCKDEMDYMCVCNYFDTTGAVRHKESESTRIVVKTDKSSLLFPEGDTVTFTCTGIIGKPPRKLIWQKTSVEQQKSITYSNEASIKEEIPEMCSFKATSNLTIQIYAEDLKAKIRCFVESQTNVLGMSVETMPFDVQFHVTDVHMNKQPNLKQYDRKIDRIIPTYNGRGNPDPAYIWFKEDNKRKILSRANSFALDDVIQNKSGVYICEAYNIIDDKVFKKTNSVEIRIAPAAIIVIVVICAVVFFNLMYCAIKKRYCSTSERQVAFQAKSITPPEISGSPSVQDPDNYEDLIPSDRPIVYDEINQQANLQYELSKRRMSVPTDNDGHSVISKETAVNDSYQDFEPASSISNMNG